MLRHFLRKQKIIHNKKAHFTSKENTKIQINDAEGGLFNNDTHLMQNNIAKYLSVKDVSKLSAVSKESYALFNKLLISKRLSTLLQAAIRGQYKLVDSILSKNPELLLERGTVRDYSGRIHVNRTAYQLALSACDFDLEDRNGHIIQKGMVELIEKYFHHLYVKNTKIIKQQMHAQYREQFPLGYDINETAKEISDSKALYEVIGAIKEATNEICILTSNMEHNIVTLIHHQSSKLAQELKNMLSLLMHTPTKQHFEIAFQKFTEFLILKGIIPKQNVNFTLLKAWYQFRWHLTPKHDQSVGRDFNYLLLKKTAELYAANYELFGNRWNSPKNLFCWQKVFGTIQRYIPASDAQYIAQGLWYVLEQGEESKRSLEIRHGSSTYFPYDLDIDCDTNGDMIGYNCAWTQIGFTARCADVEIARGLVELFERIIASKNNKCSLYLAPIQSPLKENVCVMM